MAQQNIDGLNRKAEAAKVSEVPARQIMYTKSILVIREGSKIYSAIKALDNYQCSGAPVVDAQNKLTGVISEYDLLLQAATKDIKDPIEYNKEAKFVGPDVTLKDLIVLFYKNKLKWAPVVDDHKKILGVVRRIDILTALIDQG